MTRKTPVIESANLQADNLPSINAAEHSKKNAALYVVATPIGNLEDITSRALVILQQVDLIAAEDTRHSRRLLEHFQIKNRLVSLHDHNEGARAEQVIDLLAKGESVALISDAGTPLISDPGYSLVAKVREAGYQVLPIPGVSALIAALSVAGLPTDRFFFAGFLPAKAQARTQALEGLAHQEGTLIFYESPHRLLVSLQAMISVLGGARQACIAREITKHFETFLTASLDELLEQVTNDPNQQKGEFVLLIEGFSGQQPKEAWQEACRWMQELKDVMPPSKASALVARMTGVKKKDLYQWVLEASE
ncbi:16S rRNA (cytidine(1402)-2'-O)-methyltransferase [Marinospirillum insulare]|uniref:Ribosomal RNA small subunit methyltransferase I n=1 Tax=Marinospirillum insulare TaxID=217169 RepID=A0ABQ5ZYS9_9GAMM|nr:16S rRNA (cytidine(1402)-2'-O)-methyltransferase [Marinospirillum insulare]GLR63153.1 ribosomal RNA small subunit methyltransferase I [Marinospirillum insulare]